MRPLANDPSTAEAPAARSCAPLPRVAHGSGIHPGPRPEVWITGMGLVSALGHDPAAFYRALLDGATGLRPPTSFDAGEMAAGGREVDISGIEAGEIDFDARAQLGVGRNLRPLDRTARLVVAAADRALAAAGLGPAEPSENGSRAEADEGAPGRPPVGLVLGSMFGSVRTIAGFDRRAITAGPSYAKPLEFANSVINAAAGQTAIWHGLAGVNSTLTGGPVAGLAALAYATERIRQGFDGAILAGGGEELCFESWSGFFQSGHLAAPGPEGAPRPHPFAAGRNGFALAEGAALLVLESGDAARARGQNGSSPRARARVVGHGSAFDPSRGRVRSSSVGAMERSLRAALEDATLLDAAPDGIDLLSISASGRPDGDLDEARALAAVFGERLASIPVLAVKANLGEALGASGALQTVAAIQALSSDRLPGVRGLDRFDPALPALGVDAEARAVTWPTDRPARALVHCLGLDGGTQTLILEAGP